MKTRTPVPVIIGIFAAGIAATALALALAPKLAEATDKGERNGFVCYSDGVVMEAWDDIVQARHGSDNTWIIDTKARTTFVYVQTPGTSCAAVRLSKYDVIGEDLETTKEDF